MLALLVFVRQVVNFITRSYHEMLINVMFCLLKNYPNLCSHWDSFVYFSPRKQNHVKYLPHAWESSKSTTSRDVQIESSGSTSPWASCWARWPVGQEMASGPGDAQGEACLGASLPPHFVGLALLPAFLLSFCFVFETKSM